MLCVATAFSASAQKKRKVNKMNGLSEASETKKKYNKQWIKLRNHGLPKASFTFGTVASRVSYLTDESNVVPSQSLTYFSLPQIGVHFIPGDNFGFTLGMGFRRGKYYYTTNGDFSNDTSSLAANGSWQQNFMNLGLNAGFTYYGNISKTIRSCTGFGRVQTQIVHFFWENGIIYAPSLVNEVLFVGQYRSLSNGEITRNENFNDYTIVFNGEPKRGPMLFAYSRMGFRIQNRRFGVRIGPSFEYQLNSNRGLVNDFTTHQTSIMTYGLMLAFELI